MQCHTVHDGECLVGWATADEWLEYDVAVPQSGLFDISARMASATAGRQLQLSVDGSLVGLLTSPNAGYNAFDDRRIQNVSLSAGQGPGGDHIVVESEGKIYDNFRPEGVPAEEFWNDLVESDFLRSHGYVDHVPF